MLTETTSERYYFYREILPNRSDKICYKNGRYYADILAIRMKFKDINTHTHERIPDLMRDIQRQARQLSNIYTKMLGSYKGVLPFPKELDDFSSLQKVWLFYLIWTMADNMEMITNQAYHWPSTYDSMIWLLDYPDLVTEQGEIKKYYYAVNNQQCLIIEFCERGIIQHLQIIPNNEAEL